MFVREMKRDTDDHPYTEKSIIFHLKNGERIVVQGFVTKETKMLKRNINYSTVYLIYTCRNKETHCRILILVKKFDCQILATI